ncbi:hypothetical protein X777_00419 [Ooceraea biroi]|uniref:N-acetyltransferase domain-containing protein n=1 Tax=Ooceraea biroi TaxID=2015173 RepID=A0A026WV92_OOCBI|nr:hypothetical protein X777_00419 [Ooceraea biroi]
MPSYRPWGSTDNGQIEFESLTDETLEGALNVMRKSFFLYEPVCMGVDLMSESGASEELIKLSLNAAKDGVSVVAIDVTTNEVVGVLFNKIQVPANSTEKSYFEQFSENCRYKSSKGLVDYMINIDSRINLFEHYNVDCILELMFLATLPEYGKRRIGELLISSSLELGRELKHGKNVRTPVTVYGKKELTNNNTIPTMVSGIMTSIYSQRIATKLHFERLLEVSYDDYEFGGKKFSERIDPKHSYSVLVTKRRSLDHSRTMSVCLGTDRTGAIEFKILTKDKIEDALAVQSETMHQECIAIGMGMYEDPGAPEEMQSAFREVIKDGCTVPLKPGEVDPFALFVENNIKHRSCRDLLNFLDYVESVDIFQKYNVKGVMEIFYIGTHPQYQGHGIGREITEKSLEVARGLRDGKLKQICIADKIVNEHVRPEIVFCVAASMYSQRIMEKLNFEILNELRYEEYVRGGKKMSDRIGHMHKTIRYVAHKL